MQIQIGDVRLFFDVDGAKLVPDATAMRERPTLLLLHGGPGFDHSSYKPAFAPLTDVAQIVYLDHRGNGRSDRGTPAQWNLAQWGDDIRDFCDALGIVKPVVFGNSFGGMVAMAYATRHPDHPGRLVLSSTTAKSRFDRIFAAFERLGGTAARDAAERYWNAPGADTLPDYARLCFPLYSRSPRDPDANSRTVWNFDVMHHFGGGEDHTFNLLPDLAKLRCPTLVIGGEDDPICTIDDQADIADAIAEHLVRFERFPNCGHGVYRDDPERAFALLRDFITG